MEQTRQAAGEKAVLAGLDAACFTKEETASETSLAELQALLETAGGECVGKVLQSRPTPDPHSFVGQGKAEEILHRLKEFGMTRFKLLFRGSRSRSEIVATFIAVLELCREKVIHLAGSDTDCTVECGDDAPDRINL